ncbi:MAG: hypothetical protein OEV44_03475 [Spirochaetota bacterium]|nr:hypothetical protein [Spirochaetota bacterium]
MENQYLYKKEEIAFVLYNLNQEKIKYFLSIGRNSLREDFVLKCYDVARAFDFLDYLQQKIIIHLFFHKDSPGYISRKLNIEKDQIFYLKRNALRIILSTLNGQN